MRRNSSSLTALIVLLLSLGVSVQVRAQALPPGNYQDSCENLRVIGPVLMGNCQKRSGSWMFSKIVHTDCNYIVNDNGELKCNRWKSSNLPKGSYRLTCKNARTDGKQLRADCRKDNGDWRYTDLNYRDCQGDIYNDNGRLKCGHKYTDLPKGSYRFSCRDVRVDGKILKAECKKEDGGWRYSDMNFKDCDSDIINDNGRLKCGYKHTDLPKGSYKETCRNIRLDGKMLKAECKKKDGSWRSTDIRYDYCKGKIVNDNGRLECK